MLITLLSYLDNSTNHPAAETLILWAVGCGPQRTFWVSPRGGLQYVRPDGRLPTLGPIESGLMERFFHCYCPVTTPTDNMCLNNSGDEASGSARF